MAIILYNAFKVKGLILGSYTFEIYFTLSLRINIIMPAETVDGPEGIPADTVTKIYCKDTLGFILCL
jgi:hypothetical protein